MPVHDVAQRGFGAGADAYDRARPTYPADAVAWLVEHLRLDPGTRCCDLAAGTGKLTALLASTGTELLAIEPVEEMGARLRRTVPGVPLVAGTAEALPLSACSLDAVTVAQAFHWFDADRAFAELARVLRPGGRVGILWNARDRSVDWVDRVWTIIDRVEKTAPWRDHDHWADSALGDHPGFGPLHDATFRHAQTLTIDGVIDRFASVSHVAVLPQDRRDRVLDQVRDVLATHPDTAARTELDIPYRVDTFWCERLP